MKVTKQQINWKWLFIGLILLIPQLTSLSYATGHNGGAKGLYETQLLADAEPTAESKPIEKTEAEGPLSDTWKIAICGVVMLFFLGIALFVQIRAERGK